MPALMLSATLAGPHRTAERENGDVVQREAISLSYVPLPITPR